MASTKEQLRELIERLPDDCTVKNVQYRLYVQQKVERGLEDVRAGQVLNHEEVKRQMDRKVNWTAASLMMELLAAGRSLSFLSHRGLGCPS